MRNLAWILGLVCAAAVARADVTEPEFSQTTVVDIPGDPQVTSMAWAPDGTGRLFLTGKQGEIWVDKRPVDPRAVRANIERLHAENPQGSVVIQADKNSRNELLVIVMDAAREAGVFDVSIAASVDG